MDLKNNLQNVDIFKRYVRGARLNRGKNIPNKNIINFSIEKDPKIRIIADIQGSGTSRYVVNIFQLYSGEFKVVHDCPDFRNGYRFCKHIVKILLLLETDICKSICSNYHSIIFSSDFSLVKESKSKSYVLKAEDLIQESKFSEAINFLSQAFEESKNIELILKIGEISLKYELFDLFLKYAEKYKELADKHSNDFPDIISSTFSQLNEYSFPKKVETIINIQRLLLNLPKDLLIDILKKAKFHQIEHPILEYLLVSKLDSKIYVADHFKDIIKNSKTDLNSVIEEKTLDLINEAILNMESEEVIDSFNKIAINCGFNSHNTISTKIQEYKRQLRKIYVEGLKSKHAFLRSLVIANTNNDKLRPMKFTKKYNYPTLIWGSAFKKESNLHYYILDKCGFERHHLEYTENINFIENYPVFAEIFSANNPIRYEVKNFWGNFEPKIMNTVQIDPINELEYKVNFHDLDSYVLIEWDLAQKPIMGSYICQFNDGYIIPDKTHSLTHYIHPFDLLLCEKKPIAIKSNSTKIMKPLRRISIKSAIELVWSGIEYIASYLPLKIIDDLKEYRIDELDAIEKIYDIYNHSFLPDKETSKKSFFDFIQTKIAKELNGTYLRVITKANYKDKVLKMISFDQYSQIFTKRTIFQKFLMDDLKRVSLQELKLDLKKYISKKIANLIKNQEYSTIDLKYLKKFPKFRKWSLKLIHELKKQLIQSKIYQIGEKSYDIRNLIENYYGEIIVKNVLNQNSANKRLNSVISEDELSKILENFNYLKLKTPKVVDNRSN